MFKKVLLLFSIAIVLSIIALSIFQKPFNAVKWHQNPNLRHKMVNHIIETKPFTGKTKQEIIELLGNAKEINNNGLTVLVYQIEQPKSVIKETPKALFILFKNDKAFKVIYSDNL